MKDELTERLIAETQKAIEQSRRELEHYKQLQIDTRRIVEESERNLQRLIDELRDINVNMADQED